MQLQQPSRVDSNDKRESPSAPTRR